MAIGSRPNVEYSEMCPSSLGIGFRCIASELRIGRERFGSNCADIRVSGSIAGSRDLCCQSPPANFFRHKPDAAPRVALRFLYAQ
jgi:hypothetical protein